MSPGERYDQRYFDTWYRERGFGSAARRNRRLALALAMAEQLLERPVRRVLDVGCGEGAWQPALARLRPRATYLGLDPSEYAVARYGHRRGLRVGSFGTLASDLRPGEGPFDLVVCTDVLGYVPDRDIAPGLAAIASLLDGVALLDVFTTADAGRIEGDLEHYRFRSPARWARWLREARLGRVGPDLYVGDALRPTLTTHEAPLD
jgi:SAM-dependent methyltransferase